MTKKYSDILQSEKSLNRKIEQIILQMNEDQSQTRSILHRGFLGLATQNEILSEQNLDLKNQLASLQDDFEFVKRELEEKRDRWKKRKRAAKRAAITKEIYDFLISESYQLSYSNSFRGARLRLALSLLLVTGVRISELLPLKLGQVKTLFEKGWIGIDRVKRGPANHKAFLTKEGQKILKDREKDLEMVSYFKDLDSFIFTGENSKKSLHREAWNRLINKFLKDCVEKLETKPLIRSHSFRIGFITELWRDTKDIELIGHASLNTTSNYVEILSEEDRQKRMLSLQTDQDAQRY